MEDVSCGFKRVAIVPAYLDNPHHLVKKARAILELAKPSENGLLYPQRRAGLLTASSTGRLVLHPCSYPTAEKAKA